MSRSSSTISLCALVCAGCVPLGLRARPLPPDLLEVDALGARDPRSLDEALEPLLAREQLGLSELLALAELANPTLLAARAGVGAAQGAAWQAGIYPNPVLQLQAEEMPLDDPGLHRSQNMASLSVPLVWSGRLEAAARAGDALSGAQQREVELARRQLGGRIRALFAEVLVTRRALALNDELAELADAVVTQARARVEARAAPQAEQTKAELDRLQLTRERRVLEARWPALALRLSAALGGLAVPLERVAGELPPVPPPLELAALEAALATGHPSVGAARWRAEAARRSVERLRAERLPDLQLQLGAGRDTGGDQDLALAGLAIELPLFDRNQGALLAQEYLVAQREHEAAAAAQTLRAQLGETHAAYRGAREQVVIYQEQLLPLAERTLTQTREGWAAGKLGFLDVLDAQRLLIRARVGQLEALGQAYRARADLHAILGPDLPEGAAP